MTTDTAALERTIERLRGYAEHDEGCDALKWPPHHSEPGILPCTCGLTALLADIEGEG